MELFLGDESVGVTSKKQPWLKPWNLKKAEAMVIPDKSKMGISQSSIPAGLLKMSK